MHGCSSMVVCGLPLPNESTLLHTDLRPPVRWRTTSNQLGFETESLIGRPDVERKTKPTRCRDARRQAMRQAMRARAIASLARLSLLGTRETASSTWKGAMRGEKGTEERQETHAGRLGGSLVGLHGVRELDKDALQAVHVALKVNAVIVASKFGAYLLSGSSAMLAESVHSLADVANQWLLRVGILQSLQKPDQKHPYGYGRDRFVWSLVSAVGIFCCGAGVSFVHGMHSLVQPSHLEHLHLGMGVLGVSFVAESYSMAVALRTMVRGAKKRSMPLLYYIARGSDPTTVAVLAEDLAAVLGAGVALLALIWTNYTNNSMYDAIGSIVVGSLLAGVAVYLILNNRSYLLGRSMNRQSLNRVLDTLWKDPVVKGVFDPKTEELAPGIFRFKAEIDFNGERVVENYLRRVGKTQLVDRMEHCVHTGVEKQYEKFLLDYGKDIVDALGDEVDRLEREIKHVEPGVRHVDLEVH